MSKIYQDGVTVDEILMGTVDCDVLMLMVVVLKSSVCQPLTLSVIGMSRYTIFL